MRNPFMALINEAREDRFTRALAALLEDPDLLSAFVTRILGWPARSHDQPYRVGTQVRVPDGLADILLEGNKRIAIVEAKLGAAFGDGQPENYARHLARRMGLGDTATLVILAPSAALGSYAQTATQHLAAAGLTTVPLATISWEEVGGLCSQLAPTHEEPERAFLESFADVIRTYLGETPRPLSQSEALGLGAPEFLRGLKEAYSLVDPVSILLGQLLPEAQVYPRSNGITWLGNTVTFRNREYWIGLWVDAWLDLGQSPLWAQMYRRVPLIPERARRELAAVEYDQGLACPLILAAGIDRQEQARRLAQRAVEFFRLE